MSEEEQIILSKGFRRVEYLEKPEGLFAYINTKEILNETSIIECTHQRISSTSNAIYGTRKGSYINDFSLWAGCTTIRYGSDSRTTGYDCVLTANYDIINSRHGKELYINDELIISAKDLTSTFETSGPLYLFATYNNSSVDSYAGSCRIYSLKIYTNDILVKYFIPCIDSYAIPCMYDLVSQKPFYNQGSGTFLTNKSHEWNYPYLNNSYNLPAGFKKCVYLQSDGTQWIDTGVIPNNETGLYFKALQLSYGNFVPFGVEENNNTIYPPRFSNKELYYRWGATAIKMMTWDKADDLIFNSSLNLYNSKITKFDSEDTDVVTNITSQTGTYTLPIWLFSYNSGGAYNVTYGKWLGRIYRAQITQGTNLIHDYVPCLDVNGRPCMYDLIEQEALYNQSGGTEFAYCVEHQLPSDFIKLKYLESNSNLQHIKTGYVPSNNTGMYVDAYNTVVEDRVVMGMQNTTGNDRMWIGGVMKATYGARYGWGTMTYPGGTGDVRFEASLNWLNDKKSIITCPAFTQRVNTLSDLTFTPNQDIYIFGWNRQGSLLHWKGCIYRAKISEGSEIVRDFVPAYDIRKTRPCMYDLINNISYYNDGEGEFLYNTDFEGTYEGFGTFATIGNKLGSYNYEDEKE